MALTLLAGLVATVGRAHGAYPGANGKIAFETNRDGNEEICRTAGLFDGPVTNCGVFGPG